MASLSLPVPSVAHRLPWPLPAVLAWAAAWLVWWLLRGAGLDAAVAFGAGLGVSLLLALACCGSRWRRGLVVGGFVLSALALGAATLPSWLWLLPLVPLLAAYPLRAWRDAPFFPTPGDALSGLAHVIVEPPGSVLDAGCGLGHGLAALHALWPQCRLHGVEWSRPLAWAAARRCRHAQVQRGDMWARDWSAHDLVYVFQRPESMPRVWAKALTEMKPGAWLVSLEFAVAGQRPSAQLACPDGRDLWVYRLPSPGAANSTSGGTGR